MSLVKLTIIFFVLLPVVPTEEMIAAAAAQAANEDLINSKNLVTILLVIRNIN